MTRVTVLGCGGSTGVPQIGGIDGRGDWGQCDPGEARNRRTRASILVEFAPGRRLLVDTGPDLRAQLLGCGVPAIEGILFTHAHADHVCGIDDVRGLNRAGGSPLPAWAFADTLAELRERFGYAFLPWTPPVFYRPVIEPHAVASSDTVRICGAAVRVFAQTHGRLRTLGFRTGGFAYSTDVNRLDPDALAVLRGVDTWVVDCFQREPHGGHAHLALVLDWVRETGARRTVLTHMGTDLDWGWMTRNLPPGVEPGHDGMVLEVPG